MERKSDQDLMKLIKKKNTVAFKALYGRYQVPIFNFIYKSTGSRVIAQELIQETFTRLWCSSHTFDSARGNFKGWLYTIALNITRNEMTKKEYTYHFQEADENVNYQQNEDFTSLAPHVRLEQEEARNSIVEALGQLAPSLREIVIMKNYQQLRFREIAAVLKVPESTIKSRYIKAVKSLRNYLNPREAKHHV